MRAFPRHCTPDSAFVHGPRCRSFGSAVHWLSSPLCLLVCVRVLRLCVRIARVGSAEFRCVQCSCVAWLLRTFAAWLSVSLFMFPSCTVCALCPCARCCGVVFSLFSFCLARQALHVTERSCFFFGGVSVLFSSDDCYALCLPRHLSDLNSRVSCVLFLCLVLPLCVALCCSELRCV
ncbi:hypothetical protein TRVL_07394 [Trypanosoma vivax]|nr:hypothetical protein TRVL_07394 [Trypanosoma vivax]